MAGRHDELLAALPRLQGAAPANELRGWEGLARSGRGDCAGAAPLMRAGRQAYTRLNLVPALVCAGRRDEARTVLDSMLVERRQRYVPGATIALAYAHLGEPDSAFVWLDRAYAERDGHLTIFRGQVVGGAIYGPISGDPRFAELRRRLRLVPD
jgi:hypothetical protein